MKDDRVYLEHIRDAIADLQQYAAACREAFMSERMRQDAVIRKLEIIGEAVKKLSTAARDRRPEIPWKTIAGMRDRLTHDYLGVDLVLVWVVVERERSGAPMRVWGAICPDRESAATSARAAFESDDPELTWGVGLRSAPQKVRHC